ncbi:MAG: hypothetical protein A3J28_04545 [Acidobacteria bacterium RIFCSPLOWO2_12_FULL_60_22]|nr:MAG: hypothetical protein A3J28_04545 [Acidobacteria bacterium RIFCSPLOWO2_12_FULL_60_22]
MGVQKRLGLCLLPLGLTPIWGFLIAEGYLNFGGGEKDLLLLLPWLVWSILYGIIFAACWIKKFPIRRGLGYAAGGASILVVVAWLALFLWVAVSTGLR